MPTHRPEVIAAHGAVSNWTRSGRMPKPATLKCVDCDVQGQCYDHYLGYAKEHRLDVQSVCYSCHEKRAWKRGEMWASPRWRAKIRKRMLGNKHAVGCKRTEEHKRKIGDINRGKSTWAKGKKFSAIHRKRIGDAHRGIKFSKLHRQHISDGKRGRTQSLQHRINIGLSQLGRKHSKATKVKMSKSRKKWWGRHELT